MLLLIVKQQNNTCKTGLVYKTHAPWSLSDMEFWYMANRLSENSEREDSCVKYIALFSNRSFEFKTMKEK